MLGKLVNYVHAKALTKKSTSHQGSGDNLRYVAMLNLKKGNRMIKVGQVKMILDNISLIILIIVLPDRVPATKILRVAKFFVIAPIFAAHLLSLIGSNHVALLE